MRRTELVNPFVGTAGDHGQLYVAADVPFGLVKLGPDTFPGVHRHTAHSGYDYNDTAIAGFSHNRVSGTGNYGVGGNLSILPLLDGQPRPVPERAAAFAKEDESAEPGYYRVQLASGILAELTTTTHVGLHRYIFPGAGAGYVHLDLASGHTAVRDAHAIVLGPCDLLVEITSDQMHDNGWYRVFAHVRFSREARIALHPVARTAKGGIGSMRDGAMQVVAEFAPGEPVLVKVALSHIGMKQASRDLDRELSGWDFDAVRQAASVAWERAMARFELAGEEEHRTLFYTHLANCCVSPFDDTSSNGTYMGDDGELHPANGTHYNGWSIWDSYRTKFPVLSLATPERMPEMMESLVATVNERLGMVPRDEFYSFSGFLALNTVRLELANAVLLDAHTKGLGTLATESYAAMAALARLDFSADEDRLGYVPRRPDETCQRAYDNWAAAEMARLLGREQAAAEFSRRAAFFRNVWDTDRQFFRARDEAGEWLDFPEDPTAVNEKYVYEGSAWHWRWAVVHDVAGMVELFGGREAYAQALGHFFDNDLHNHGNEPGVHAPWMFAATGTPWLSQKWVRMVLTEPMVQRYGTHGWLPEPFHGRIYRNEPEGMIPEMDDDDGCMAGWYVLSSLGLFPVCVGHPLYAVGMPLFEESVWHGTGGKFRIRVKNHGADNWYIQSATLNGKPLVQPWLAHQDLAHGGELELVAGPEPSEWGMGTELPW
jgi:predicted alpha-1,2-mannosidase